MVLVLTAPRAEFAIWQNGTVPMAPRFYGGPAWMKNLFLFGLNLHFARECSANPKSGGVPLNVNPVLRPATYFTKIDLAFMTSRLILVKIAQFNSELSNVVAVQVISNMISIFSLGE